MTKPGLLSLILAAALALTACSATPATPPAPTHAPGLLLSASFYPVYLAALEIISDIDEVRVETFIQPQAGYLEDFRLSELDWMRAQNGDILLMLGGGLEDFLSVFLTEEGSPVLVAGENIERIPGRLLDPDEDTEPAPNPYTWLSPTRWAQIVDGMAAGLAHLDASRAEAYIAANNLALARIAATADRLKQALAPYQGRPVIVMHPALAYLADDAGLQTVLHIERDPSILPTAEDIADLEAMLAPYPDAILLLEADAPAALRNLAGHRVALCETLCVGIRDGDATAWERAMEQNIAALVSALL